MKSKLSPLLQNNTSAAGTSTGGSTGSTGSQVKKRKYNDNDKHVQTLSKAKTELTNVLTTNVKEKINHEIELLKATLEKEKLKIELLKLLIQERSQKQKKANDSDIIIIS